MKPKKLKPYPEFICVECGVRFGVFKKTLSIYHVGICEFCGKEDQLTNSRDFGYPPLQGFKKP